MEIPCWPSCGDAWIALLRHVRATGGAGTDDRGPILEADPQLFEIATLSWEDPIVRGYGDAERVPRYRAKFDSCSVIPPFKYSYGARLRDLQGVDQIRWATKLLADRPYSKSAWISLTVPGERADAVPCLTAVAFRIRGGGLAMTATFRSQNAYTAYLNYLPLRSIQSEVACDLGLPTGAMRVFVDVPHLYVADADEVDAILAAVPQANAMRWQDLATRFC